MARPFDQYDRGIESTQADTPLTLPALNPDTTSNAANNSGSAMPMSATADPRDTGDDRPIQDNGTQGANFSCGGLPYTPRHQGH